MDSGTERHYPDEELQSYLRLARRMARRWGVSPADADDLAQEAIVRLLQSATRPERMAAWLFVVTRRLAARRHADALRRADAERHYHDLLPAPHTPTDRLLDAWHVLQSLRPAQRTLLLLVAEGYVSREIAAELHRKERDIGQLVSRARKQANALLVRRSRNSRRPS